MDLQSTKEITRVTRRPSVVRVEPIEIQLMPDEVCTPDTAGFITLMSTNVTSFEVFRDNDLAAILNEKMKREVDFTHCDSWNIVSLDSHF